jgi:hypothetical protein
MSRLPGEQRTFAVRHRIVFSHRTDLLKVARFEGRYDQTQKNPDVPPECQGYKVHQERTV